jgi:hypothetical protein
MTRRLAILAFISFALLLAACGGSSPDAGPPEVESAEDVQRISAEEAKALVDSGEAVLYDARSAAAYEASHAAGAVSFPAGDAAARASELPTDKSLVFY